MVSRYVWTISPSDNGRATLLLTPRTALTPVFFPIFATPAVPPAPAITSSNEQPRFDTRKELPYESDPHHGLDCRHWRHPRRRHHSRTKPRRLHAVLSADLGR